MAPGSRLLIVEMILAPDDAPHPGKLLDLAMLVMPGGRERTEGEYAALLRKAGLSLTRVIPTASAVCVLEAVSADDHPYGAFTLLRSSRVCRASNRAPIRSKVR